MKAKITNKNDNTKNKYIGLRVSQQTYELLEKDAKNEGLNVSTKIRQIINLYYQNKIK